MTYKDRQVLKSRWGVSRALSMRSLSLRSLCLVVALVAATACGGGGTQNSPNPAQNGAQDGLPETSRIRLAVPTRDPVWDWSNSMGPVDEWRGTNSIQLEADSPPNRFAALAGGHVDVAVINAWDVVQLAERTDFDPVIIGKHSTDETFLGVSRNSPARDLRDLSGGSIAVDGEFGSTLIWGVLASELYGLNLHTDSSDFQITIAERASLADLVVSGAVDACICRPQFSVQHLLDERLRRLYDGRTGGEIYLDELGSGPRRAPMTQALVTSREWYDSNPNAVSSVLALWQSVLDNWRLHVRDVVVEFPNRFSVETDDQINWMVDYLAEHDWFLHSTYLDSSDARTYMDLIDRMQRIGLISPDAPAAKIKHVPRETITAEADGLSS